MIKVTTEKLSDVLRNTYAVTIHYYHGDADLNVNETFCTTNSDIIEQWFRFAEALRSDDYNDWSVLETLYSEHIGLSDGYTIYDVWEYDKTNSDVPVALDYVECTFYDADGTQWECEVEV